MAVETLFAQITPEVPFASRKETSLLPVCCVCRLIREETGVPRDSAHWYRKTHGVNPADFPLTHTYCPKCFTQVMDRMRGSQAEA
jgi:hypothetical protein